MSARIERVEVLRRGPWLAVGPARRAEWVRVTIHAPSAPASGLRFVHLSDLHLRRHLHPAMKALPDALAADPPDAVLITGDFVDDKLDPSAALPALSALLPRLTSRAGTFAVLGNHDGDLLAARLPGLGVTLVAGRRVRIEAAAGVFDLVGLAGLSREDETHAVEFERDPIVPMIVLSHFPDVVRRLGRLQPDVTLAGHTHGGQVCLPGARALMTHDSLPRRMACGAHDTEHGCLVVSRGLGHTLLPIRAFAAPQVVEIVLVGEQ